MEGRRGQEERKKPHVCNLNLLSYGSNETRHALKKHKLYSESQHEFIQLPFSLCVFQNS